MINKVNYPTRSLRIFDRSAPRWYTGNNASLLNIEADQREADVAFSELSNYLSAHLEEDSDIGVDLYAGGVSLRPQNRLQKRQREDWSLWSDFSSYNLDFLSYRSEIRYYRNDGTIYFLGRGRCAISSNTFKCLEKVNYCAAILSPENHSTPEKICSSPELSPETFEKDSILEMIAPGLQENQVLCYGWEGDYYEPYTLSFVGESSTIELLDKKLSA